MHHVSVKEKRSADITLNHVTYWKVKQANFPSKALHLPSRAPSERLFDVSSVGKNVLQTLILRLKPENIVANIFLKYNIRALGNMTEFSFNYQMIRWLQTILVYLNPF